MPDLLEKQFELDGVVFGWGCDVDLTSNGFQPGTAERRAATTDIPSGDGRRFGIEYRGGSTWSWTLFTNMETEEDAWTAASALQTAWDAEHIRRSADEVVALRYRLAGQTRVIYGRPTRFTANPGNTSHSGKIDIVADFETVDHRVYDDEIHEKTVLLAAPLELDAGLDVPFEPPFDTFSGASVREDGFTVGGEIATPLWLTFEGPLTNGDVQVAGQRVVLAGVMIEDEKVIADGRPWVRSVTRETGGGFPVNGRLTRMSKLYADPGTHEIVFTGIDITSTAKVTVSWRNARRSPR